MASNLLYSDGPGLQPTSDGLPPNSDADQRHQQEFATEVLSPSGSSPSKLRLLLLRVLPTQPTQHHFKCLDGSRPDGASSFRSILRFTCLCLAERIQKILDATMIITQSASAARVEDLTVRRPTDEKKGEKRFRSRSSQRSKIWVYI